MLQLFYCSDCFHIYFRLPSDKKCAICKNQLTETDIVGNQELLTCETCHYIYTPLLFEKLIPQEIENPNFLCACINRCPTNSELSIGKQEYFIGNIVLAKQYRCSNCGAISIRNPETHLKECAECGSKYVFAFQTDPTKYRYFYQCINPNHGIRLKYLDLIENVNSIIQNEINRINTLQDDLKQQYQTKLNQLHQEFAQKGMLNRIQQKLTKSPTLEQKIEELNEWTNTQRLKLYSHFRPIGLRCAVQQNPHEGCGALSQIYSQKIMTEVQETMMKKSTPKETQEFQTPIVAAGKLTGDNSLISSAYPVQVKLPNLDTSSSHLRSYYDSDVFDQVYRLISSSFQIESLPIFSILPKPKNNEIFLLFQLDQYNLNSKNFVSKTHGIFPLRILQNNQPIRFGRQEFLRIQWKSLHTLSEQPYIWDTITPTSSTSCQFFIEKREKEFLLLHGENVISPMYRLMSDSYFSEWDEENSSIKISPGLSLMLKLFHSIDHCKNDHLFYRVLIGFIIWTENTGGLMQNSIISELNKTK